MHWPNLLDSLTAFHFHTFWFCSPSLCLFLSASKSDKWRWENFCEVILCSSGSNVGYAMSLCTPSLSFHISVKGSLFLFPSADRCMTWLIFRKAQGRQGGAFGGLLREVKGTLDSDLNRTNALCTFALNNLTWAFTSKRTSLFFASLSYMPASHHRWSEALHRQNTTEAYFQGWLCGLSHTSAFSAPVNLAHFTQRKEGIPAHTVHINSHQ